MNIEYKILTEDEAKELGLFKQLNALENNLDKDQEKYMEFDELPDTFIYSCAFDNNKLVGSVMSAQNKQDDSIKKDRPLVRFNEVFVDPKYRRMGIATNLVKNLMSWWKDKDPKVKFSLGVFAGNKDAIRIYEKLGFKPYLYKMINKNFSYKLMNDFYEGQNLFKLTKDEINCGPDKSPNFYIFEIKPGNKNDYNKIDNNRALYVDEIITYLCESEKNLSKELRSNIDKYNKCLPGIYLQELNNGTNNGDYDKLYKIDNTTADHGKTFRNYQILRDLAKDYPGCSDDGFHYLCMSLIGENKVVNLDPARLVFDINYIINKNFSLK